MLELGQRVRFTSRMIRVVGTVSNKWVLEHKGRVWTDSPLNKPMEGVVVGFRYVRDGFTEYGGYDESNYFVSTRAVPAYLIATNLYQTPWKVNPEDVEAVEGSLL